MKDTNELIPISDMYLASVLISYGYAYERVDRSNPRRLKFMFQDKPCKVYILVDGEIAILEYKYIDQIEAAFHSKALMVMPRVFDDIRGIKSVIHRNDC